MIRKHQEKFLPLSLDEEKTGKQIVNAAFHVHQALGPGLLESIYEVCFCHELSKDGLKFSRQVPVPIEYDGIKLDGGLRLDVLVEDLVICELIAVELLLPVHQAQIISYLKLTKKRLGYLVNFDVPLIKDGIHRFVL